MVVEAVGPASYGVAQSYRRVSADDNLDPKEREAATIYTNADLQLRREEHDEAIRVGTEALTLFRELGDMTGQADILCIVARAYINLEKREEANKVIKEELARFRDAGDKSGEAKMMLSFADCNLTSMGDKACAEALESALQARQMFKDLGEAWMEARALLVLARVQHEMPGDLLKSSREALRTAEKAATVFRGLRDRRGEAEALHWQAVALGALEEFPRALRFAYEALAIYKEIGEHLMAALELQAVAEWNLLAGSPEKALPAAEEAMTLVKSLDFNGGREAQMLKFIVRALIGKNEAKEALRIAQEYRASFRSEEDQRSEADVLLLIAECHLNWEGDRLKEAVQAGEEALGIFQALQRTQSVQQCQGFLPTLYIQQNEPQKAKLMVQTLLDQDLPSWEARFQGLNILCSTHVANGEMDEAMKTAHEILDACRTRGDKHKEGPAMLLIADLENRMGEDAKAFTNVQEASVIFREFGDKRGESQALSELAQMHVKREEHKAAARAADRAIPLLKQLADDNGRLEMMILYAQNEVLDLMENLTVNSRTGLEWELLAKASKAAKDAIELSTKLWDSGSQGCALHALAQANILDEKYDEARNHVNEAVSIFKDSGDVWREASALILSAKIYALVKVPEQARDAASQALALCRQCGDEAGERIALEQIGSLSASQHVCNSCGYENVEGAHFCAACGYKLDGSGGGSGGGPALGHRQPVYKLTEGQLTAGPDPEVVRSAVQQVTRSMVGASEDVEADLPLMDLGVTSMAAVMFRQNLMDTLTDAGVGAALPATLIFDYPSVAAITDMLVSS